MNPSYPGQSTAPESAILPRWAEAFEETRALYPRQIIECAVIIGSQSSVLTTSGDLHMHAVGCVAKAYTAAAVVDVLSEHGFGVDQPIRDYFPTFKLAQEEASAAVTMRHLLSHASGIDERIDSSCLRTDQAFWERLAESSQLFWPGQYKSYCDVGFLAAYKIAESLDQRTWNCLVAERVLARLNETERISAPFETFQSNELGVSFDAAGGLQTSTTAAGLAAFGHWQMSTPGGRALHPWWKSKKAGHFSISGAVGDVFNRIHVVPSQDLALGIMTRGLSQAPIDDFVRMVLGVPSEEFLESRVQLGKRELVRSVSGLTYTSETMRVRIDLCNGELVGLVESRLVPKALSVRFHASGGGVLMGRWSNSGFVEIESRDNIQLEVFALDHAGRANYLLWNGQRLLRLNTLEVNCLNG